MERKAPPPFARPGAPGTPPTEQSAPPPPQSFGFPAARVPVNTSATRRGWRPGRVGGRHDSPLYGKHRKRPSSSSIDSNVSWSGSEIESVGAQEQPSRLSWASETPSTQQELAPASSLFGAPAAEQETKQAPLSDGGLAVQPPKTPLGKPMVENEGGLSAAQRVRMELSTHAGSRAGSRANSSENVFAVNPPVYDEEKNGPQSCPSAFNNLKQAQFSLDKIRAMRSNELVASKLLPTRTSVNSLMGYVRELQLSEATLRKQLVKTKQHTEEELTQSLSKVNELERSMQEVERDREMAKRKLEEQEQLIRDLAAKLKHAEAAKTKTTAAPAVDELPPIAEEVNPQAETDTKAVTTEELKPDVAPPAPAPAPAAQPALPPVQQEQAPAPPVHPGQPKDSNRAAQFGLASPRSPNRPLWDPWASGGATPMKNLPPVFTIGSTGLDPVVASSTSAAQMSQTNSTTGGDYELKSVLMSPRRVHEASSAQELEQSSVATPAPEEFAPQYPAPMFNVGAMPSPPYPQQQDFVPSETQNEAYGLQSQEEVPLMESPSQAVPMLPIETMPQTGENPFEQQQLSGVSAEGSAADYNATECYGMQGQQELPPPAASFVPPVGPGMESSAGADSSFADHPTVLPPPTAPVEDEQSQHDASQTAVPFNESVQSQEVPHTENVAASVPAAPPVGSSPPPPASEVSKPLPASPALKEKKAAPAEPVSLETLLVDFFTEVDKKRLKMAKVYGKRYAGREKWLFAELTKRYGAAKVSSLKARLETGSSAAAATTSNANTAKVQSNTNSTAASDQSKPARQGHPRHPQFFHPTAPANSVDLSGDVATGPPQVPPPLVLPQENDNANTQGQQAAEGFVAPPSPSGKMSPGRAARVSPRPRRSGGTIPPFGGPPPPFSLPQGTDGSSSAVSGGMDGLPVMNDPPPSTQQNQPPSGQFNQPPPPQNDMDTSNAAPMGLRQRHNASAPTAQGQKTSSAGPPSVTLEGLLKELYKKHQPDKLKNVAIVAKQYAGKERELVGLLKGKYGALSVKRLEENLEVLERAYRERIGSKGFDKKRGCFVRTISLLFWLSVLLYFSLGAVFVSFVMLDAWECRALDIEEQEQELESGECAPLKKELDAFTYERVGDYVSQPHPEACFCSEWKARESALLSNLSGEDLVNLARLVPFSPDSFGKPWIASVKEQTPSQEFYESYAKPVVDLSLDLGSFVWSSALELAGYDEASQKETGVKEDVVENDTTDLPSSDDIDVDMDSLERPSEAVEKEMLADDGSVDHLAAGVEAEVDSFEMADVVESEQGSVEGEASTSEEELQLEDIGVKVAEEEEGAQVEEGNAADVEEEHVIPDEEEAASVDEDSYPLASEATEEEDVDESLRELKSEDARLTEETEPVEDAQSVADTESIEDTESVEDAQPIEKTEPFEEAQPIEDTESVEDAQPSEETEPIEDAQPIEETEPVEDAQPIEETEPVEDAQPIEETEPVEDAQPIEETELVGAIEEEPNVVPEMEVEEVSADDSIINASEENESVGGDDDEASFSTETEVPNVAVEDALPVAGEDASDASDAAGAETEEAFGDDVTGASDDVVEVEVRQEGLDLSYSDKETAVDEIVSADSSDAAASDAAEVMPVSSEVEAEFAEFEDGSPHALEEEPAESAGNVADEDSNAASGSSDDIASIEELHVRALHESSEVEAENGEAESSSSEDLNVETSVEEAAIGVDSESSVPIDVDEPVLALEEAVESLSEESELDGREDDVVTPTEIELEAATPSNEEDASTSDETPEDEEGSIEVVAETEQASSSSDNVAENLLIEEDVVGSSSEQSSMGDDEGDDDHSAPVEDEAIVSEDSDASLEEEVADLVSSTDDVDELAIPAVDDPVAPELEPEGDIADVSGDEEMEQELVEKDLSESLELEETVEEDVVAAPAGVEETAGEEGSNKSDDEFASIETADENVSADANEDTDVGNEDAVPAEADEVEEEQPASDEDLVSELAAETVTIEATEIAADEEESSSPEPTEELDEHAGDRESIEASVAEEGTETSVANQPEPAVAVDEATPFTGDEADVVASEEEETLVSDSIKEVATDAEEANDEPSDAAEDVEGSEEASITSEPVAVDEETTGLPQEQDETEQGNGGLVSAVNEVLARLVEPFEAAKTAAPEVATEGEHGADEL